MTATKGIEFEGRFFWAYDVAAGVFLKHLIDEAEASEQADAAWLSQAVSDWRVQAVIIEFGLTLEEEWSSAQRQIFTELADAACKKLRNARIDTGGGNCQLACSKTNCVFFLVPQRKFSQRLSSNWAMRLLRWCLETCRDHRRARLGSMERRLAARRSEWIRADSCKGAEPLRYFVSRMLIHLYCTQNP